MTWLTPIRRNVIAVFHDLLMAAASMPLALGLRLGFGELPVYRALTINATVSYTLVALAVFLGLRLYQGVWRYVSMPESLAIGRAVVLAEVLFLLVMFWWNRLEQVPRSLPVIHTLLCFCMLMSTRFTYRLWHDRNVRLGRFSRPDDRIPVILAGLNDNAELFLRESNRRRLSQYRVVGILDDAPRYAGRTIHGIPVLSPLSGLADALKLLKGRGVTPHKVVVTNAIHEGEVIRSLLDATRALGLTLAKLPRLSALLESDAGQAPDLRPIALADLLGRPQTPLDRDAMQEFIAGQAVLVTGAGGAIGSELVRQIAGFAPRTLILLDHSEFGLYTIDTALAEAFPDLPRIAILADVRDREYLAHIFADHRPEVVFHAAAIKHVPLAEENIEEAVLTNIMGTQHIADLCLRHRTGAMVLISTDKAVNPTSVMGCTKRVAERYCQSLAESGSATRFVTVRFGNVLGTSGSVVPRFQEQLGRGGPITITHPDMERFFMTVREAVELVIQASALAEDGENDGVNGAIYVLNMGTPVRIRHLAEQMIRLAGLEPEHDIAITYTGLRPGEKMTEELFYSNERHLATSHESITRAASSAMPAERCRQQVTALIEAARHRQRAQVTALLRETVPEYRHPSPAASTIQLQASQADV